jgi:hypothetical protein
MQADLETYRALYPEHEPLTDALIQLQIDDAVEHLSRKSWGRCYPKAVLSYTAHEVALAQARKAGAVITENGEVVGQATGTVASASAGGLSVSFAVPASAGTADAAYFSQTPYGQRYLALRRECLSRGHIVGCRHG